MTESVAAKDGLFEKVSAKEYGYNIKEVEEFFALARTSYSSQDQNRLTVRDIQRANFEVVPGGYNPEQVDSILDRLEDAMILKQRNQNIATSGENAWLEDLEKRTSVLLSRLQRPMGERFRAPVDSKAQGYRAESVDAFANRLRAYVTEDQALRVSEIREITFPAAVGNAAYDEQQVDEFLNRFIELAVSIQ